MIPQDRAPAYADVETFGQYFLELLSKPGSWIRRQVETIRSTSRDDQEVRYSFDIDYSEVVRVAKKHNVKVNGSVLLPLLILKRQSIVDIDVVNHDGRTINILRRGENAFLTHAAWLASEINSGAHLTKEHFDLYHHFRNLETQVDIDDDSTTLPKGSAKPNFDVFDLVIAAPLPGESDPESNLGVLKIRHRVIIPQNEQQVWERDKLSPILRLKWRIPYRSSDLIPHLRFEIPDGLIPFKIEKIHHLKFHNETNQSEEWFWKEDFDPKLGATFLSKRLVTVRDVVATEQDPEESIQTDAIAHTVLSVRTRISSTWLLMTFIPSLISSIILGIFYYLEKNNRLFTLQLIPYYMAEEDADYLNSEPLFIERLLSSDSNLAVLTLAAIIPSIWGLYISRPKEHYAFSSVVLPYRTALLISSFALFIFGIVVSLSQPHEIVLNVSLFCLMTSGLATAYIALAWAHSLKIYLQHRFTSMN